MTKNYQHRKKVSLDAAALDSGANHRALRSWQESVGWRFPVSSRNASGTKLDSIWRRYYRFPRCQVSSTHGQTEKRSWLQRCTGRKPTSSSPPLTSSPQISPLFTGSLTIQQISVFCRRSPRDLVELRKIRCLGHACSNDITVTQMDV